MDRDVEVRPEVVFLHELLIELSRGDLRIPRFQRPFVWRREQMTELLDSVYRQYPIGSLLVWETEQPIATLSKVGPFQLEATKREGRVGYVLDGHQRLSTLAGALIVRGELELAGSDDDPGRWELGWDLETERFQHRDGDDGVFPLTSVLDTMGFLRSVERLRARAGEDEALGLRHVNAATHLARAFQQYRVPVIRIRNTDASEAVEIFARLNSKGQAMSADQMVSALMFRDGEAEARFDLASEIDELAEKLEGQHFAVDRTIILRAILANLDEDIYRTDWTRLAAEKRDALLPRMRAAVTATERSLELTTAFLRDVGVMTGRLLPYSMQLVLLSAFFDRQPTPSPAQRAVLERWFWVSSFAGWFGGANSSRVNGLIREFRDKVAPNEAVQALEAFDLNQPALAYPRAFDMRSARARALVLVMLDLVRRGLGEAAHDAAWRAIAEMGPSGIGRVYGNPPKEWTANPANRVVRLPGAPAGTLQGWLSGDGGVVKRAIAEALAIDAAAATALGRRRADEFLSARQNALIEAERVFQDDVHVRRSEQRVGEAPITTEL